MWNFDYNANGMPTHYSHPNGMLTQYAYDNQNRLTDIEHMDGMTVKQGFAYTFDDNSNVASVTHEDGSSWAYTYDGRDRLTLAIRYDASAVEEYREAYTYDPGDNLLTKTVTEAGQSPVTTTYTVNDANGLLTQSDGATNISYTYDAAGRQAAKTDGTYTTINSWRFADMLYKVETTDPNVPDITYDYGGNGMRRQRTTSDGAYTWYNDDGSEEDAAGALVRTHFAGLAEVVGPDPATGTATYFTQDRLGSTRGRFDATKTLLNTVEFTPYGGLYSTGTPGTSSLYTGHSVDPVTEIYYTQFRYYDPSTARWLSREPLGLDGPNLYHYALGNPVNFTDPDGLAARGESIVGDFLGGGDLPGTWGGSWANNAASSQGGACAAGSAASFLDGLLGGNGGPQFGSFNPAPDPVAHAIGAALGAIPSTLFGGTAFRALRGLGSLRSPYVQVSQWGGMNFQSGSWVVKGPPTRLNYLKTTVFTRYRYSDFSTASVRRSQLTLPMNPMILVRWPLGHRMIR